VRDLRTKPAFYRLRDEPHATILVACSKCDWKAAFDRDALIASHGPDHLLTDLLGELASPTCGKVRHHWDPAACALSNRRSGTASCRVGQTARVR